MSNNLSVGNDQIIEGVEKTVYDSQSSLRNSSASLTITPLLTDDEYIYTCIMNNDALMAENPEVISAQKADVSLYVLGEYDIVELLFV